MVCEYRPRHLLPSIGTRRPGFGHQVQVIPRPHDGLWSLSTMKTIIADIVAHRVPKFRLLISSHNNNNSSIEKDISQDRNLHLDKGTDPVVYLHPINMIPIITLSISNMTFPRFLPVAHQVMPIKPNGKMNLCKRRTDPKVGLLAIQVTQNTLKSHLLCMLHL